RRRHTRFSRDWSSDVCSSDLEGLGADEGVTPRASEDVIPGAGEGVTPGAGTAPGVDATGSWAPLVPWAPLAPGSTVRRALTGVRSEERRVGEERSSRRAPRRC